MNFCIHGLAVLLSGLLVWQPGMSQVSGEKARQMAENNLLIDTHIDLPILMYYTNQKMDISVQQARGEFDLVRARKGGLNAAFMSIYVPSSYEANGGGKDFADGLIDLVSGFQTRWPEKCAIARSPAEVRALADKGMFALPLGMENGTPIEGDLANLRHFYDRGIRYITLCHSENNHICDSATDKPKWNGLSPFGRKVIAEMNRLGIMIDVSHVSDETFYQVLELSKAPVLASHSSARKFTPSFARNMSDDMIRALAAHKGVMMINFSSIFLREDLYQKNAKLKDEMEAYVAAHPEQKLSVWAEVTKRQKDRVGYAELDDVVAHYLHVIGLVGTDHLGFGSDFDGVGDTLPNGLKDVAAYPNLIEALLEKGLSQQDIAKICSGNLMRVWEAVARTAEH